MLHVPGLPVMKLQGRPLGENARVQVLSHGVPEVVSAEYVYAVGLLLGAAEAAVICLASAMIGTWPPAYAGHADAADRVTWLR